MNYFATCVFNVFRQSPANYSVESLSKEIEEMINRLPKINGKRRSQWESSKSGRVIGIWLSVGSYNIIRVASTLVLLFILVLCSERLPGRSAGGP